MYEHARHCKRISNEAGVLSRCAAKAAQRVFGNIMAALHGNLFNRVRHVAHRDVYIAFGDLLRSAVVAGAASYVIREGCKFPLDDLRIERSIAADAEHRREEIRLNFAKHHIAVGDGEWTVFAIARWSRVSSSGIRADAIARAIKMQNRSAAGSHRMN